MSTRLKGVQISSYLHHGNAANFPMEPVKFIVHRTHDDRYQEMYPESDMSNPIPSNLSDHSNALSIHRSVDDVIFLLVFFPLDP